MQEDAKKNHLSGVAMWAATEGTDIDGHLAEGGVGNERETPFVVGGRVQSEAVDISPTDRQLDLTGPIVAHKQSVNRSDRGKVDSNRGFLIQSNRVAVTMFPRTFQFDGRGLGVVYELVGGLPEEKGEALVLPGRVARPRGSHSFAHMLQG